MLIDQLVRTGGTAEETGEAVAMEDLLVRIERKGFWKNSEGRMRQRAL